MSLYSHPGAGWSIRHWRRDDYPQMEVIFRECLAAFPWRGSARDEVLRLRQSLSANIAFVAEENDVPDTDTALAGARDILAERLAEHAEHRATLRSSLQRQQATTFEFWSELMNRNDDLGLRKAFQRPLFRN